MTSANGATTCIRKAPTTVLLLLCGYHNGILVQAFQPRTAIPSSVHRGYKGMTTSSSNPSGRIPFSPLRGIPVPVDPFTMTSETAVSLVDLPSSISSSSLASLVLPDKLLSYSDDPLGDLLFGANGAVVAGIVATIVAVGFGFVSLLPKVGAASFTLTEEEEDAVERVTRGYDSKVWEQESTEEGTKGYVNRRRQAREALEAYLEKNAAVGAGGVKNRSLRYAESDLSFLACLLRAAEPQKGDRLVDLGSGTGRTTLGAAALFPSFQKCVGVEFLAPLVKLSKQYVGKVKGRKASVEFVEADMADYDLGQADMVFCSATYLNNGDLEQSLTTLRSGAKVMIMDKRLPSSDFSLITQVEDPSGDLVLNTGYVYEKL